MQNKEIIIFVDSVKFAAAFILILTLNTLKIIVRN